MALYDSGHSSSVSPAVQRREQLLRALVPPTTDANITSSQLSPEAQSSDASPEAKSEPQASVSRSQEIAHEVLSAGPLARFSLSRKDGASTVTAGLRQNLLRSASGGGGGPENPIFVTISERVY